MLAAALRTIDDGRKKTIFARLENEISSKYGVKATISDPQPLDGVVF